MFPGSPRMIIVYYMQIVIDALLASAAADGAVVAVPPL